MTPSRQRQPRRGSAGLGTAACQHHWRVSPSLLVQTSVHIITPMAYEWDAKKAKANHAKHGVHFADAVGALEDERALSEPDDSTAEERFRTVGMDFLGHIVVVVYAFRGEDVRLISARMATPRQRARYERTRRR